MTARYRVIVTPRAQKDIFALEEYLVRVASPERADAFEAGLKEAFITVSKGPHFQIAERESEQMQDVIRRYVYRPTKNSVGYLIFFSIVESPRPDPEPETDFFAGLVYIMAVRLYHGSSFCRK